MRRKMPSVLTLVPAAELSLKRLVNVLNEAYEGYYFPIHLSVPQFERMCYQEDIDLEKSVVTVIGKEPVGAALLSIRGRAGWVSGVGVLSSVRRQGVATRMVRHLQATAQSLGLGSLQLEVLVQNKEALALYQQAGFALCRNLDILLLEMWDARSRPLPKAVIPADPARLLALYDDFHDVVSPWQRQNASIDHRLPDLEGLALWEGDRLSGYLIYDGNLGTYTILDIAVAPDHPRRIEVAQALLQAVYQARTSICRYVINNLPADDPLHPAFTTLGFVPWYRQHELVWEAEGDF